MLVLRKNRLNPVVTRRRPIDSFFNELLNDDFFNIGLRPLNVPIAGTNVFEQDGNLVYEIELPGLSKDAVKVQLEDGVLNVSGEISRDETIKEEQFVSVGRQYGAFKRTFSLPEGVLVENPKKINAKLENGVLTIRLPLAESLQPEAYDIKVD